MDPVTQTMTDEFDETGGSDDLPETVIEPAPQEEAAEPEKPQTLCYVGPSFGGSVLMTRFTCYRGDLPKPVKELKDKDPHFSALFVPVRDLARTRAEMKRPGSRLARIYKTVAKKRGKI